jgi:hypothetical protein
MSELAKSVEILANVASELTYLPIPEQRKAKSAFYARFNDNPVCEPQDITQALAAKLAGDNRINKWWAQEGFKEWFRNRDEFRQRMEYLTNLAIDRLEAILIDPKSNSAAQVSAAKLIMEVAKKMPSKQAVEQYLDEKIAQMNRQQLEEYISKSVKLLRPVSTETDIAI